MRWVSQFRSAVRQHIADPGYFAQRYGADLRSWWLELQRQSRFGKPVVLPRPVQVIIDLANTLTGSVAVLIGVCVTLGIVLLHLREHSVIIDIVFIIAVLLINNSVLNMIFYCCRINQE